MKKSKPIFSAKPQPIWQPASGNADNYDQFKIILDKQGGFVRTCWCGKTECEDAIKAETGATIRTLPFQDESTFAACVKCGMPSKRLHTSPNHIETVQLRNI